MKAEHTVNLGITVKVELSDTTINLINRLLNSLEDKIISNNEKENKIVKHFRNALEIIEEEEAEAKEKEIVLKQISNELAEVKKNEEKKIIKEIAEEVRVNKLTDEKTTETEETEVSLEQLRAGLSDIREKCGKDLIKELLEYVGANKLSDVKKEDYGKLMKKIKEVK